ncbi:sigma-54-dependent transcriptional regulator [Candidatus Magnetomonas plexicatena]|uniref:sigma-54-dependent transcriptional regulator n=1 Tax=Candidatus Magnetomonas plexicatena TaxID=2552947 RepID=UPI001C7589DC|nr:sigma-54-dependent Fis family transcriptional regulator [Nitrospirales bacterium LBB_01]
MSVRGDILFVGKDAGALRAVEDAAGLGGRGLCHVSDVAQLTLQLTEGVRLALIDFSYLNGTGVETLTKVKAMSPAAQIIVLYEDAERNDAMSALAIGAFFCMKKPFYPDELRAAVERAWERAALREELEGLRVATVPEGRDVIGSSNRFLKALKDAERLSGSDAPVLILGETGTGKRNLARFIHYFSQRKTGRFLVVNADSMSEQHQWQEIFGLKEGNFAGHNYYGYGSMALSTNGTLYISEIAALTPTLQEKLLDFIKTHSLSGSTEVLSSDARVIASSRQNLPELVRKGLFLKELREAFADGEIRVPPLRERKADIIPLAEYFLAKYARRYQTGDKKFGTTAIDYFMKHYWPDNVKELKETVKRAAILTKKTEIQYKDMIYYDTSRYSISEFLEKKIVNYLQDVTELNSGNLYSTIVDEVEKALISIALKETSGNQLKASRILGINRNTLRTKAKQFQMTS